MAWARSDATSGTLAAQHLRPHCNQRQQTVDDLGMFNEKRPLRGILAGSRLAVLRSALTSSLLVVSAGVSAASAEVIRCLPPDVPMTALPAAVLTEYRAELSAEFESYFSAISVYIACLDSERARALSEAKDATADLAAILSSTPDQKERP